jgi:S-sulfosulfanyl-L-cysteine sulfohydrolase
LKRPFAAATLIVLAAVAGCANLADHAPQASQTITLIHTGDFHGHLIPRADVRGALAGKGSRTLGGLARVYTVVEDIRKEDPNALLIHTGDTIQGSAEALFTRGQALVEILNNFKIDAFAPGNWEFVYGSARFIELFAGAKPVAPWNAIAANAFYATKEQDATTPYADRAGQRVLPPFVIKQVGDVKIGILGLTTDRGPQVVGRDVTKGLFFLPNNDQLLNEVRKHVAQLREVEKVNVLVLASEMGLANNIRIVELIGGIDLVLSSDMHEETVEPIIITRADGSKTILAEEGQDGTQLGRINLTIKDGKVSGWTWRRYVIDDNIVPNAKIADMIEKIRSTFVAGDKFVAHANPFNQSKLKRPIDTVIGRTAVPLLRENFSGSSQPGLIEGASHHMLADAFQSAGNADIGAIRGFRYGTQVPVGPVKYEDLFHFIPIGPQIAVASVTGAQIKAQLENSADGSMNPDVSKWTGGWLFNYSDTLRGTLDPYAAAGQRALALTINGTPLNPAATYRYASYWYAADPCSVNGITVPGCTAVNRTPNNITILKDTDGGPLDAAEVVARYIESQPNKTVNPTANRIKLAKPLPPYRFGFPEVQPLRGVQR